MRVPETCRVVESWTDLAAAVEAKEVKARLKSLVAEISPILEMVQTKPSFTPQPCTHYQAVALKRSCVECDSGWMRPPPIWPAPKRLLPRRAYLCLQSLIVYQLSCPCCSSVMAASPIRATAWI